MSGPLVLIRADAGHRVGMGHVARCRAIAEALIEEGARVLFVSVDPSAAALSTIAECGAEFRAGAGPAGSSADLERTLGIAAERGARFILLDGYHFDEAFRAGLRRSGAITIAMDDLADRKALHADLVINPAPRAADLPYGRIAPGARLLLGPTFAPLRREFREALRLPSPPLLERRTILVSFGGSDPMGLTRPTTEALLATPPDDVSILVLIGGGAVDGERTAEALSRLSPRIEAEIDARDVARLMTRAGLAISAAGGTAAELAAMAVPAVLVVVADNQEPASRSLGEGFVVVPPDPLKIVERAVELWCDPARRAAMSLSLRDRVDGLGATRIARAALEPRRWSGRPSTSGWHPLEKRPSVRDGG